LTHDICAGVSRSAYHYFSRLHSESSHESSSASRLHRGGFVRRADVSTCSSCHPQKLDQEATARRYSRCSQPSIDSAGKASDFPRRRRDGDSRMTPVGGPGTPGPNAMYWRQRIKCVVRSRRRQSPRTAWPRRRCTMSRGVVYRCALVHHVAQLCAWIGVGKAPAPCGS
jgi:hypothetical protein